MAELTVDRADGFLELYRREYAAMVRLAHLITGSNEVAEDLVQDAFVRVYRSWARPISRAPTSGQRLSTAATAGTGAG